MTDMILVYITCESVAEAKKIGRHLMEKRLCACVNIFPDMQPMFFWPPKSGKIDESKEVVLIVKTLNEKFEEVEKEVVKTHSSDTPCIFSIKVDKVSQKYFDWLKGELE